MAYIFPSCQSMYSIINILCQQKTIARVWCKSFTFCCCSRNINVFSFFIFSDLYEPTGEILGNGAYASVRTYRNLENEQEYAVKVSCLTSTFYMHL